MALNDPYRSNEFVVEIGTVESPTVSKVSGLSMGETDTIEVPEGGTNVIHKVSSGVVKFQPLTIERYVDGSPDDALFKSFFETMFKLGQGGQGSNGRRDGSVVKKHFGQEVFRFAFYGAWVKSASFSDLEAGSTNLLKQTIVLEHDGLELIVS
ncbi:phage tail protein [Scytonema sp. PCC 10023]|uniref:phage tail protein n=1 Tax=Scytonema sp. PCC 10023 TaxID=1680591 RepID=UPI0039C694DF